MTIQRPGEIAVTGAVQSHLDPARRLLTVLAGLSERSLLADAGGFFEGTAYYRVGGGAVERAILTRLYDVVAPGTSGFVHYLADPRLRAMTVCANLVNGAGNPVFIPSVEAKVAGRSVVIAGILGQEAFERIPADQRRGLRLHDPGPVLNDLQARLARKAPDGAGTLIVLSHSGWEQDLALAERCPHLTSIICGCDPGTAEVRRVGNVQVVAPAQHAHGYARVSARGSGWHVTTEEFGRPRGPVRAALYGLMDAIGLLEAQMGESVGLLRTQFRSRTTTPEELLALVSRRLIVAGEADAVLLNAGILRPRKVDRELTIGDLHELAPHPERLVLISIEEHEAATLADRLAPALGAIVVHGTFPEGGPIRLVTSQPIADAHLRTAYSVLPATVLELVRAELVEPLLDRPYRRALRAARPPHPRINEPREHVDRSAG